MKEFVYNGNPRRLTKIIAENFPLFSYNQIVRLIRDREIRVDGVKVSEDVVVCGGSSIRCYAKDVTLKAVYEDDNITVVYKPKGIPSEGAFSADSLVKAQNGGAILCHRLDTNTDGLLMFAKSQRAYEEILKAFKDGRIVKKYSARVYKKIPSDVVYTNYLVKNSKEGEVKVYSENRAGAARIVTEVRIVGYDGDTTIIEAVIHNGKTHQIRAQLAAHGHFILGDSKYGRDDINRKYNYKKQQLTAKKIEFNLNSDSFLSYLNNQNISLE